MQDAWLTRKAEEMQGYADRNEWKNVFAATKAGYGPPVKGATHPLYSDGRTLLTEKMQILMRWAEHFQSDLNQPSTISDAAIDRLTEVENNSDLELPPSLQETIRTVQQLSSGKASGSDAMPAEFYEHGGPQLMNQLTVAAPSQLHWSQHDVDAEDSVPLQDFRVPDPVLPVQVQYFAEAAEMEVIQLPGLVRVDSPGFRSIKECHQDEGLVHLHFGVQVNTVAIPHGDLQPDEGLTGFGDRLSYLVVDSHDS
ncbi:unnamed protein product [Schistocephalus solidus]|uniref:Uncharacterized protein n=1 Tax=Schistocephalus solidus TaxID=70667 RepID=A0A183SRX7_SCHSO|nr:unnamed protein product [Schistocephalus solidus]